MARRAASRAWLSLTPEPERDLPAALATLRAGGEPTAQAIAAERIRAESLVLAGSERAWLAWLHEALDLAAPEAPSTAPAVAAARAVVLDVIDNHHGLIQGLPGRGAERAAADRARVRALLAVTRNGRG